VGHRPGAQRPSGRPALRRGDDVHAADRRLRRLPRAAPTGTAKGADPGQCTSLLRVLAAAAVRPSHLDDRGSLLRHYVLVVLGYLLSGAFGWLGLDLSGLSGFEQQMATLPGLDSVPITVAVGLFLLLMVIS